MELAQLLNRVRRIRVNGQKVSGHLVAGAYRSRFKGKGIAFDQIRRYQYGDDTRAIDWNVTARLREPFVKVFTEEREQVLMLLVDVSASGAFGTMRRTKRELIGEICALLAFAAVANKDRVGAILVSDCVEKFIPAGRGEAHVLAMIHTILTFAAKGRGTNLHAGFDFAMHVLKKKSILFVLSDFIDAHYRAIARTVAQKHFVTAVRVHDPLEAKMPNVGWLPVRLAETGQIQWLNTFSPKNRAAYARAAEDRRKYFEETFATAGAGHLQLSTSGEYANRLIEYLQTC